MTVSLDKRHSICLIYQALRGFFLLAKTVYIFNYYSCLLPLSYPSINIKEIIDTGVVISDSMENKQTLEADTVVIAIGYRFRRSVLTAIIN
jgi:hypothetical protein